MSDTPEKVGASWPQVSYSPIGLLTNNTRGFLPPDLIPITDGNITTDFRLGSVNIRDWRGVTLDLNKESLSTKDRFELSRDIPKGSGVNKPYSTRDYYLIFGDQATDYFRHGLHIIDNLTPLDDDGSTNLRLNNFKGTSYEHNDPVMFGFEIIFDDIESPLLNGSVIDFLNNYSSINEVAARIPVYEDFKNQFTKFFNTKANVRIDQDVLHVTRLRRSGYPEAENDLNLRQGSKKKSYLNYYLKKIDGLDKLIERNTPDEKKYLQEYNKDIITLTFDEDLTLNFGTLARLYKLLYWSKPNGKGMVPENLLRFNCDIIISEVRNYNRVRKILSGDKQSLGDIEFIKDNVSRYVYSLSECQFYFDTVPHDTSIDLSDIKVYSNSATVKFDYKFSTTKFERWVPYSENGDGAYAGYDEGAIWKIGSSRSSGSVNSSSSASNKSFMSISKPTSGVPTRDNWGKDKNYLPDNPNFVLNKTSNSKYKNGFRDKEENNDDPSRSQEEKAASSEESQIKDDSQGSSSKFEDFKNSSIDIAKKEAERLKNLALAKASTAGQASQDIRQVLLNNTLNKIRESLSLSGTGLKFQTGNTAPNLYKNATFDNPNYYKDPVSGKTFYNDRLVDPIMVPPQPMGIPYSIRFYDVRAQLMNFVGDSLGDRLYSPGK